METIENKYIAVAYKMYAIKDGKEELAEEAGIDQPFQFISGFGLINDCFEDGVKHLATGDTFDFILPKDKANGEYDDSRVIDVDRSMFCINGHFDHEHIFVGAIVPMQNADGMFFNAKVLEIKGDKVKLDMNSPFAGYDLRFKGVVVETRVATAEEIQGMINRMSGEGCCCGGHCGDDCGGGCGGGHHHHGDDGCGCGHCH